MAYTRKQLDAAIAAHGTKSLVDRFYDEENGWKAFFDLDGNRNTLLNMVITDLWLNKVPDDENTETIREAWCDLKTDGFFKFVRPEDATPLNKRIDEAFEDWHPGRSKNT